MLPSFITKNVILHSFAHLSDSKATPDFTKELFNKAEARLKNAEYKTFQTPFGYFLDLSMDLPGISQVLIIIETIPPILTKSIPLK